MIDDQEVSQDWLRRGEVVAAITGHPVLSEIAPVTGPMYQLFIFFMITDPKTSVRPVWGRVRGRSWVVFPAPARGNAGTRR